MDDFRDMMGDVLHGFIIIGTVLGYLIFAVGLGWGIISAILVLAGRLAFAWWLLPCWILLLITIAGCIGSTNRDCF